MIIVPSYCGHEWWMCVLSRYTVSSKTTTVAIEIPQGNLPSPWV
jgi:hypothetical protein